MYTSGFSSETIKKSWMIMSSQDVLFVSFDKKFVHTGSYFNWSVSWVVQLCALQPYPGRAHVLLCRSGLPQSGVDSGMSQDARGAMSRSRSRSPVPQSVRRQLRHVEDEIATQDARGGSSGDGYTGARVGSWQEARGDSSGDGNSWRHVVTEIRRYSWQAAHGGSSGDGCTYSGGLSGDRYTYRATVVAHTGDGSVWVPARTNIWSNAFGPRYQWVTQRPAAKASTEANEPEAV